ncbi:MAG: STAS domain-containing protein [Terriglobales bacterium]
MPTSIGIFTSSDQAEHAVHELLAARVPEANISLLTPHSSYHRGQKVGAFVGGAIGTSAGLTLGLATATLLVPGVGQVLAIGLGAATLLALGGATAGKAVGAGIDAVVAEEHVSDLPDAAYFRTILQQNRSVIVVQTDDADVHARASAVLDRLSIPAEADDLRPPAQLTRRYINDVFVIAVSGRMVLGDANATFHDFITDAINRGSRKILVDLSGVTYIDSSAIGELVNAHIKLKRVAGQLKLAHLSPKVHEMIHVTQLDKVIEIHPDESEALTAFA